MASNRKANLMKNLHSSDRNSMVASSTNVAEACLATPACTALIWGLNIFAGANSAIWGTSAIGGANKKQECSAIWGTRGVSAPMQHVTKLSVLEITN